MRECLGPRFACRSIPYLTRKDAPRETVYELTTQEAAPQWGLAIADIERAQAHVHDTRGKFTSWSTERSNCNSTIA